MGFLIYVVPGVLLFSSLMGTWFLSRMIIKLDDRNKPMLHEIMTSIERTNEISRKIDSVLLDGKKSRQHHQKLFEHDRVLLASLNSQVAKLDVMMRVASQNPQAPNIPPSGSPGLTTEKRSENKRSNSTAAVSCVVKLDRNSLPRTEQGISLLEQLFNRRQLAGKSDIIQRTTAKENFVTEPIEKPMENTQLTARVLRRQILDDQQKSESPQKPQAPRQQSNPKTILNLFASGPIQSTSATEQERRRA